MVKVMAGDRELYLDGYLKSNLDLAMKVIKKDWDMVFTVDGYEGSGKSVIAQQCAKYLDPTLTIERIAFNSKEFKQAINKADKYQAVVYDEAYGGLASRQAMSAVNKALVSMLAQIRQKNLYVFIVLPCFFELDKYVAVWRSRALIHVYTGADFERGFFSFFNQGRKKDLYMYGKKFYEYKTKPNFRGRFSKGYAVDEKAYRKKKLDSLSDSDEIDIYLNQRNAMMIGLVKEGWQCTQVAKLVSKYSDKDITRSAVSKIIHRHKEDNTYEDPTTEDGADVHFPTKANNESKAVE